MVDVILAEAAKGQEEQEEQQQEPQEGEEQGPGMGDNEQSIYTHYLSLINAYRRKLRIVCSSSSSRNRQRGKSSQLLLKMCRKVIVRNLHGM